MTMKIAVIPARGGSKRIPHKNIRQFVGKPIIAYSIAAAKESGLFDGVVVSTDDPEIAEVACAYGAEVPFLRPKEIADDYTGTNAVVKHALEWFIGEGRAVRYACCIYATAPFVSPRYLSDGFHRLVARRSSFAFSVTRFPFAVQRALRLTSEGTVAAMYPEYAGTRSQDLEEAYHDAGQFYWGTSEAFLEGHVLFSPASVGVVLPRYLVQDIDTAEDWEEAELMYRALKLRDEPTP